MIQDEPDYKRLFTAIFASALLLITWQTFVQAPRKEQLAQYHVDLQKQKLQEEAAYAKAQAAKVGDAVEDESLSRDQRLKASPRIAIRSDKLHGSIALKGARFDDLTLAKYRVSLDKDSPEVILFSPNGEVQGYFAQAGWTATDGTKVPDDSTLWHADKTQLTPDAPVTLRWSNGEGVNFIITIALDADYMFTLTQSAQNNSGHAISLMPYGYINRTHVEESQHAANVILHEGPLGVMTGALEEVSYKDLREKAAVAYDNASGWFGITDKYWAAALIPGETGFKTTFSHYSKNARDRYQVDYLGTQEAIAPGATSQQSLRLFAGAKEIKVLDRYADGCAKCDKQPRTPPIPLFDRAVDFGSLYFMTKPMFLTLNFFYTHIGNFGIAILLLTIIVKGLMFPLATKSYKSMARMRVLQPEVLKIRERYFDDQIRMNKEMMELYKRERVNPASGCLPLLIQMPVFFALYKVLFVSIEMRHAPFFAWIKDLSAADPANIFTLFGLLEWQHPAWMQLGILPMLMCATMVIQMKQQPKPADPIQAKMIGYMPYFMLFLFASFPAGLVLYWVWSNTLSILQQHLIYKWHGKPQAVTIIPPPKAKKPKKAGA